MKKTAVAAQRILNTNSHKLGISARTRLASCTRAYVPCTKFPMLSLSAPASKAQSWRRACSQLEKGGRRIRRPQGIYIGRAFTRRSVHSPALSSKMKTRSVAPVPVQGDSGTSEHRALLSSNRSLQVTSRTGHVTERAVSGRFTARPAPGLWIEKPPPSCMAKSRMGGRFRMGSCAET